MSNSIRLKKQEHRLLRVYHFQVYHFVGYTNPSFKGGLVRTDPGGMVLYPAIVDHAENLYRFRPRENDVWILTFPKCGNISIFFMLLLIILIFFLPIRYDLDARTGLVIGQ